MEPLCSPAHVSLVPKRLTFSEFWFEGGQISYLLNTYFYLQWKEHTYEAVAILVVQISSVSIENQSRKSWLVLPILLLEFNKSLKIFSQSTLDGLTVPFGSHAFELTWCFRCKAKTEAQDFVIRCGSREWKVHKLIVSAQSDFLDRAAYGPFKVGHLLQCNSSLTIRRKVCLAKLIFRITIRM